MNLLITEKPYISNIVLESIDQTNIEKFHFNPRFIKYKSFEYSNFMEPQYEICSQNLFLLMNKNFNISNFESNFDFLNSYEKIIFAIELDYSAIRAIDFFIKNFLNLEQIDKLQFFYLKDYLVPNIKNSFANKFNYAEYIRNKEILELRNLYTKKDYVHFNFLNITEKITKLRMSKNVCHLINKLHIDNFSKKENDFFYFLNKFNHLKYKIFSITALHDVFMFLNDNKFLIKCKDDNFRPSNKKFIYDFDYLFDIDLHNKLNDIIFSNKSFIEVESDLLKIFEELEIYSS